MDWYTWKVEEAGVPALGMVKSSISKGVGCVFSWL